MQMKNYSLHSNKVTVYLKTGRYFTIYFTPQSGSIYYRFKVETISNVKHPDIFVGVAAVASGTFYTIILNMASQHWLPKLHFAKDSRFICMNNSPEIPNEKYCSRDSTNWQREKSITGLITTAKLLST